MCWLVAFLQVNANELTNGVINAAFMLLFKDSIRLFAAYNEGIINLLGKTASTLRFLFVFGLLCGWLLLFACFLFYQTEKYFDMKKTQCKEGLDIYKKFLTRMTRISEFLKVAEVSYACLLTDTPALIITVVLCVHTEEDKCIPRRSSDQELWLVN